MEQGMRDVNGWWKVYGTRTKKVTHWMPLPPPPTGRTAAVKFGGYIEIKEPLSLEEEQ